MARERITGDPSIMMDKPVIRGTRLTVEHILRELGGEATVAELMREWPGITENDIRAA